MNALIKKAIEITPGATHKALVSIRELRSSVQMSKSDFDKEVLELAGQGRVFLHKHVDAGNLPQSERDELVTDGQSFYMGMVLRMNGNGNGNLAHPQTKFEDLDNENSRLKLENSQLRDENIRLTDIITRLQGQLDDLKQGKLTEPVLCKCGCGRYVRQADKGRKRQFYNNSCKTKFNRAKQKKLRNET